MPERRTWPLAGAVGVLAGQNLLANELLPGVLYVPGNLAATGALAWLVRRDRLRARDVGLRRRTARRGAGVGAVLGGAAAAGLAVALAIPTTRPLLEDQRVAGLSGPGLAYQALVRVPLGTVVLEEFAFRGALPAMLAQRTSRLRAAVVSQALFGLWHIAPTLSNIRANALSESVPAQVGLVAGAVVATAGAGGFLLWLRRRTDSLLAPAVVHAVANSAGTVAAWVALRAADRA